MADQTGSAIQTLPKYSILSTEEGYSFHIFDSFDLASSEWNKVVPADNIFLQGDYLTALELYPPEGMEYRYLVIYQSGDPIGIVYCQIQYFKADESINQEETGKDPCFFKAIGRFFKGFVSRRVEFNTLVCGNLLLTGEHGYYFHPDKVDVPTSFRLLKAALDQTIIHLKDHGKAVSVTFLKDYFKSSTEYTTPEFTDSGFHEVNFQPSMIFDLDKSWKNFDDYLNALYSKYRVRARRAFKKGSGISKRELGLDEIQQYSPILHDHYQSVANNAGFNALILHPEYFFGLKKKLGEAFKLVAYFSGDKLVGFYTTILNYHELEAHFMGFEPEINYECQTYLNMLYDITRNGIYLGVDRIVFARTALEIKSSVGAEAHEMYCYLRHQGKLQNSFMKSIVKVLNDPEEWQPRHPFKSQDGE